MMDIKAVLLEWIINFLIQKTSGGAVKNENMTHQELAEKYTNQLLENLKKEKYIDNVFYRQCLGC